jgi:hypothetical protein
MKLRHLFAVNFCIAVFFGLACSIFPRWVFQLYGAAFDDAAIWSARLVGGSILGYATLMWFGFKAASVEACRAIALALLVQDGIGFIASMEIQLSGGVNAFGWISSALYAFLALAYAFFFFIRKQNG